MRKSELIRQYITDRSCYTADMLNYDHVQHLMTDHLNKKADNARQLWLVFVLNKWRHHVT